jgi:hypothetical protein
MLPALTPRHQNERLRGRRIGLALPPPALLRETDAHPAGE